MTSEDVDAMVARGVTLLRRRIDSLPPGDEVHLDRWLLDEIVPSLIEGLDASALLRALDAHRVWRLTVAEKTAGVASAKPRDAVVRVLCEAIREKLAAD